jgi:hypothetical protein
MGKYLDLLAQAAADEVAGTGRGPGGYFKLRRSGKIEEVLPDTPEPIPEEPIAPPQPSLVEPEIPFEPAKAEFEQPSMFEHAVTGMVKATRAHRPA